MLMGIDFRKKERLFFKGKSKSYIENKNEFLLYNTQNTFSIVLKHFEKNKTKL